MSSLWSTDNKGKVKSVPDVEPPTEKIELCPSDPREFVCCQFDFVGELENLSLSFRLKEGLINPASQVLRAHQTAS
jgi:hypothetical protein